MKRFGLALQFLTRLPLPAVSADPDDFAASIRWFPAVGIIIGLLLMAAAWAAAQLDSWIGALAALAVWTWVTGALHLDGLGDIADAAGAAHKGKDRLIAVLRDPHAGSFAIVAIATQLIAKLILLHHLIEVNAFIALAPIPFAARIAPLCWARWLPPLHEGLGSRFRHAVRAVDLILWALALIAAAMMVSPSLLSLPLAVLLWGRWIRRHIGGISGDGHGAGIEITETTLLVAASVMAGLA